MKKLTLSLTRYRHGLTLIEVVAGLALMSTILVALLTLKARFTHQLADSNRQLRAVAAADLLLEQWWADPTKFPVDRSGPVPQDSNLSWQTHLVSNREVATLDCRVVQLDILADYTVISSVELILPNGSQHVAK